MSSNFYVARPDSPRALNYFALPVINSNLLSVYLRIVNLRQIQTDEDNCVYCKDAAMKNLTRVCLTVAITAILPLLAACGGVNDNGTYPQPVNLYTVGGTVAGLNGTLALQNNDGNSRTVSADGSFTFATPLANGAAYNTTVSRQPQKQTCTVNNGSGTIQGKNVTNIQVVCTNNTGGVTLSGKIAVPEGVVIDGSVNDLKDKYVGNETFGTAQVLPNPISVGGYVNKPRTGTPGRSYSSGNPEDFYQVQLKAGDVITLAIGDLETNPRGMLNDLDLFLYPYDNPDYINPLAWSIGTGAYELIIAPSDGIYIISVYAESRASNYVLTIGADISTAVTAAADPGILSSQREMVPGQVVIRFKDDIKTVASTDLTFTQSAADMGLMALAGSPEREMLFSLDELKFKTYSNDTRDIQQKSYERENDASPEQARLLNTLLAIKELRKRPDILSADPNYIVRSYSTTPDDTHYGYQWNLPMINMPEAWNETTGSDDVIVAVVDTGVLMNHPDLAGRLTNTGYNFVEKDGVGPNPDDPGDKEPGTSRSSFHGTHVAGIIAAKTNNGIGVAGVTWNTKIMPVRVIGAGGSGSAYDMRQGIRYAAGLSNDYGVTPSKHADIINLSLGGTGSSVAEQSLINEVRAKGIIVIAAAGNENRSIPLSYPAAYNGVVSVSAVNISGSKASYSNFGSYIDVAAPGGDSGDVNGDGYPDSIVSTGGDDSSGSIREGYTLMAGTSMASPHVAGVAALMKAVRPKLSPAEFDTLLAAGKITNDIGDPGKDDKFGHGLINAFKAVAAAKELEGGVSIAGLDVNPRTVNFGVFNSEATVTVSKIGTGALSVAGFSSNAEWLTVTPPENSDGLGGYTLRVDRSLLFNEGAYSAVVTFTASSGISVAVSVTVQRRTNNDITYTAGYHYVVLLKVNEDDNIAENLVDQYGVMSSDDGYYHYVFNNVQNGKYLIVAGSDRNNNGYIGDGGEALGAYSTVEQMVVIEVEGSDIQNLDFTTNLVLSISNNAADVNGMAMIDRPVVILPEFKRLQAASENPKIKAYD